jgi:probable rRNA maturation factor
VSLDPRRSTLNPEPQVAIQKQQAALAVDEDRIRSAVLSVLEEGAITTGAINIAVVDDATIRELNRRYLNHDYATDVLSFVIEQSAGHLEGEILVSAETARSTADRFGWRPEDELLLYVIHGALHLIGHDDQTPAALAAMRAREAHHLARFGLQPRYE